MDDLLQKKLKARIETFAEDVAALLAAAVRDSLAGAIIPTGARSAKPAARASAGTKKTAKKARLGRPPSSSRVDLEALFRAVKAKPNQRMEQLSKSLRVPSPKLSVAMKQLVKAKRVKVSGKARGTNYRVAG